MSTDRDLRINLDGIEDEYEIIGELGRGGIAVVYLARDRELGREVAIKVIRDQYLQDPEAMARFEREARTLAQLQHPNIITLYSARRLTSGGLVLVMQLTRGLSLREMLRREGAVPFARAEQVLRDIAGALAYLHRRGVVHRDIKPENIFFDEASNRALLSDFGIAKACDGLGNVTMTGIVVGTPAYMSPEQIDGSQLDGRSDLYSLGLVGWELLAGQQPWEGENLYSIIVKQRTEPLPSLENLRPGVPEPLRLAIERATEKDHSRRWSDAEELLAHLDRSAAPAVLPQPHAAEVAAPGELLPLAPAARGDYVTVEFRPTAVVSDSSLVPDLAPAPVAPRTRPAWPVRRGGTRTYLAAAGVVLFAGGAAMIPLVGTGTPPVQATNAFLPAPTTLLAGPPPVDAARSDEPAPPIETPPEQVEPVPAPAAPPAVPAKKEPAREEAPGAVPSVEVALSLAQQRAQGGYIPLSGNEIQPNLSAVASPAPSSRVVIAPEVAPVLNNRQTMLRQMEMLYPAILRDRQIGGTVLLSLLLDEAGTVIESNLRSSSGYSLLDDAAVRIGRSMSFTPAQHQGRQVRTRVEIPLVFDAQAPRD